MPPIRFIPKSRRLSLVQRDTFQEEVEPPSAAHPLSTWFPTPDNSSTNSLPLQVSEVESMRSPTQAMSLGTGSPPEGNVSSNINDSVSSDQGLELEQDSKYAYAPFTH